MPRGCAAGGALGVAGGLRAGGGGFQGVEDRLEGFLDAHGAAAGAFVERLHHLLGVGEGAAEVLGRDLLDHTAMLVENAEDIARDWAAPLIPELTAGDEDAVVGARGAEAVHVARFLPAELAVRSEERRVGE